MENLDTEVENSGAWTVIRENTKISSQESFYELEKL
jgi:hypothetical protein